MRLTILMFIFAFTGCSIPEQMLVRSGNDPKNQDEDTRFRTTYYFRVFDECVEGKNIIPQKSSNDDYGKRNSIWKNNKYAEKIIVSDALYRFRVTGKADSLTNNIHFEAGTLEDSAIDPFGSTVKCEKTTNQCYLEHVQPPKESKYEQSLKGTKVEIEKVDSKNERSQTSPECKIQKRFMVMGPEGVEEYDIHKRLVLAMSSSGQPLLDVLRELAGRKLEEGKAKNQVDEDQISNTYQHIAQEALNVNEAKQKIEMFSKSSTVTTDEAIDSVINTLLLESNQ